MKTPPLKSIFTSNQLRLDSDLAYIPIFPSDKNTPILPPKTDRLIDSQRSKAEVLDVLSIYKDRIINSIKYSDPISQLHFELNCRLHLPYDELLEWRVDNYPSTNNCEDELLDFDTTQEISEILTTYYLEAYEIKIPYYQYTSQDFEFATKWQTESMNYATKVLLPVVKELLVAHFNSEIPSQSQAPPVLVVSQTFKHSVEDICLTWGGHYNDIELVNTCPMDNFITMLSLQKVELLAVHNLTGEHLNATLQTMFSMIDERNFDKLRLWLTPMLGVNNFECNFLGYESKMVDFFKANEFVRTFTL